jgi:hypothetical protein
MSELEFFATRLDVEPEDCFLTFYGDDDDVGIGIEGSGAGGRPEGVALWYGADDENRESKALDRASITDNVVVLHLTASGKAIFDGHDAVRVTVDVPDLDAELEAVREVLRAIFAEAPARLAIDEKADPKARVKARARAASASPAPPALVKNATMLVSLLVEKKMIELAEDATAAKVAQRIAPLFELLPEKRAAQEVIAFLFDDASVDEVYVDEDVLSRLVREFL